MMFIEQEFNNSHQNSKSLLNELFSHWISVSSSSLTENFCTEIMLTFEIFCLLITTTDCIQTRSNRPVRTPDFRKTYVSPLIASKKTFSVSNFSDSEIQRYCSALVCLRCYHLMLHSLNEMVVKRCIAYSSHKCCRSFINKRLF